MDAVFYLVYFFAFVLVIMIIGQLWDNIDTAGFGREDSPDVNATYVSLENVFPNFNYNLVLIFAGIGFAVIFGLFMLPSNPALKFVGILIVLIITMVAAILANVYEEFTAATTEGDQFGDYAQNNFGAVNTIFSNYPLMIALFVVLAIVALLGKRAISG